LKAKKTFPIENSAAHAGSSGTGMYSGRYFSRTPLCFARFFGEFHFRGMAFAVDRRWNKTDLIAEVELRENRSERGAVLGWRGDEKLTTGVLGHVMEDLRVFG
jgi:hypothetical protein